MTKQFLRKRQVAARYGGITERAVDKMVAQGRLPKPVYLNGSRFPLWDLDELVHTERDGLRTKPAKPAPQPAALAPPT
jgi:predicted DNA-binding transcriptional regulator AlpA